MTLKATIMACADVKELIIYEKGTISFVKLLICLVRLPVSNITLHIQLCVFTNTEVTTSSRGVILKLTNGPE